MSKVMRTVTIEYELNEKLKQEQNASALVEQLLEQHFKTSFLRDPEVSTKELDQKAEELNLELEKINQRKIEYLSVDEVTRKLKDLGIVNRFLVDRLRNMDRYPSVFVIRELKEQYGVDSMSLWYAWRLLHPETPESQEAKEVETNETEEEAVN